jgi:ketosteroid isomerase-like protein
MNTKNTSNKIKEVIKIAKEEIITIMHNFKDAYNKKDLEESLSFVTEDANWFNPSGTLRGKKEIENYLK